MLQCAAILGIGVCHYAVLQTINNLSLFLSIPLKENLESGSNKLDGKVAGTSMS